MQLNNTSLEKHRSSQPSAGVSRGAAPHSEAVRFRQSVDCAQWVFCRAYAAAVRRSRLFPAVLLCQLVRCDEYRPSRRRRAATLPGSHSPRRIRRLHGAVNLLRTSLVATSDRQRSDQAHGYGRRLVGWPFASFRLAALAFISLRGN